MLNPHRLNSLALGQVFDELNYPLSWIEGRRDHENIRLAWEERGKYDPNCGLDLPIAIPATYQDHRMIAQRSCFTVHGKLLESIPVLIRRKLQVSDVYSFDELKYIHIPISDWLYEYEIDNSALDRLIEELAVLGVTGSTILPDLDNLGRDIASELGPQ